MKLSHRTPPARRSSRAGLTLIELMIAMVVVAILAALVYPSFMNSVRKSRRAEAFSGINTVQQAQERFRANKASFAASITNAANGSPPGLALSATPGTGLYTLSLTDVGDTGYTVLASAASGKSQAADAGCEVMAMRSAAGNLSYGSGSAAESLDWTDVKRCWSR